MTTENNADVLDGRSEGEKIIDKKLGKSGPTPLDRKFGKIVRDASFLMFNTKHTRRYLQLGEDCDAFIIEAMATGEKRSVVVNRIASRLLAEGLGTNDVRVNDWIAVYGLARLCTGCDTVEEMPASWVDDIAYRTLAILKIGVDRGGVEVMDGLERSCFAYVDGWAGFVADAIRTKLRGDKLRVAVTQHKEVLKTEARTDSRKGLSPDRVAQIDAAEAAKDRDKKIQAINTSAEAIRVNAMKAQFSPADVLTTLINRKVVALSDMDMTDLAKSIDTSKASALAEAICRKGDHAVISSLAGVLQAWLDQHASRPQMIA